MHPWGWTWVDDAPWGFAPFHYGRWVFVEGAWGWLPGPAAVRVRPVYAPALVAFVGGSNWSVSIGIGGGGAVGWFPLGPREVYVPAYRTSPAYVNRVNVTNVTNITNVTNVNVTNVKYVNQSVPGAVTAVSHENFASSRPVAQTAMRLTPQAATSAQVVGTAPQIAPRAESVMGHSGGAAVARPPAAAANRRVLAKTAPPPPPVPFARHQEALAAHPGRPVEQSTLSNMRRNAPAEHPLVRVARPREEDRHERQKEKERPRR